MPSLCFSPRVARRAAMAAACWGEMLGVPRATAPGEASDEEKAEAVGERAEGEVTRGLLRGGFSRDDWRAARAACFCEKEDWGCRGLGFSSEDLPDDEAEAMDSLMAAKAEARWEGPVSWDDACFLC